MTEPVRCHWCLGDPLYVEYHDKEWGVPLHDDQNLFELLLLEGAQAGLSWLTVLRRREHYRKVYDGFDPEKIARYDEAKNTALMADAGIIRHRLKVSGFIKNARAFLELRDKHGSFGDWVWKFVDGAPVQNARESASEIQAQTPQSIALSKSLRQSGFTFVGPTICHAFMQAAGLVNDHLRECFRHDQINSSGSRASQTK